MAKQSGDWPGEKSSRLRARSESHSGVTRRSLLASAALLIATLMWLGPEAHNVDMGRSAPIPE